MAEKAVRVEGLRELERAFKLYGRGMEKGIREALEAASEPVKSTAQALAVSSIRQSAVDWTRMRIGVTRRTAYVAPVQKGARGSSRGRPNVFDKLVGEAMEPALAQNIPAVERELGDALNDLGRMWSRV